MIGPGDFRPNRREQRLEWWLRLLMRYVVGPAGLGWEALVRGGQDPLLILAFALLATSLDAFSLTRALLRSMGEEGRRIGALEREDRERE